MRKADQFSFPIAFTGEYPNNWAGYTFLQSTTQNALHPGIDWNWKSGEEDYGKPIQLIANGLCVHQSKQDGIGYGIISVFKHELTDQLYEFVKSRYNIDTHNLYSFYAHQKDELVNEGKEYLRGDLIGYIGRSGTTVSHLHQELYKPIPGTQWRYWPTLSQGWDEKKLKQYYIDTYNLIVNQPLNSSPQVTTDDLILCQKQLSEEIIKKNTTFNELVETRTELEASQSEIKSYKDFQTSLAVTLKCDDQPTAVLGQITKLLSEEDQLRQAIKSIEDLKKEVSDLTAQASDFKTRADNCLLTNKTLADQATVNQKSIVELEKQLAEATQLNNFKNLSFLQRIKLLFF